MALALGKTVGQLLDEIGSYELVEWIAYAGIEPFGIEADDYRAGLMPALTANSNQTDRSKQPLSPRDFFPWAEKAAPAAPVQLSPEDTAKFIRERIFKVAGHE